MATLEQHIKRELLNLAKYGVIPVAWVEEANRLAGHGG